MFQLDLAQQNDCGKHVIAEKRCFDPGRFGRFDYVEQWKTPGQTVLNNEKRLKPAFNI